MAKVEKAIIIDNVPVYEGYNRFVRYNNRTYKLTLIKVREDLTTEWTITDVLVDRIVKTLTVDHDNLAEFIIWTSFVLSRLITKSDEEDIADEVAAKWRIDKEDPSGIANGIAAKWSNK